MKTIKEVGVKIIKITVIACASVLLLLLLAPFLFPRTIESQIKSITNRKIDGEIDFSRARLSFFTNFPSLTANFHNFTLKGFAPYRGDTLLAAKRVGFGINLMQLLFNNDIVINKLHISDGFINIKVNERGQANYNVYVADPPVEVVDTATASDQAIKVKKITISGMRVQYSDASAKIAVDARGVKYTGEGNLSESVFDLHTRIKIDSLDVSHDNTIYLRNKAVKADFITNINTYSLAFIFRNSKLKVNKLPINFSGKFEFLKDGYDIDFEVNMEKSDLDDFFGALPPYYVTWLDQSKIKGQISSELTFKGSYNVSKQLRPDLVFNVQVRDGFVRHGTAPIAVSNLYLDFKSELPSMKRNRLNINIDSLSFNIGKDYLIAEFESRGFQNPFIRTQLTARMNVDNLLKAFGIPGLELRGQLSTDIAMTGVYNAEKKLFPVTNARIDWIDGWIKTKYYPNPITDINISANLVNTSGQYKDMKLKVNPIFFLFEDNPFHLIATLINFDDIDYDVKAKGEIDLANFYKVFAKKDLDLTGFIKADLSLKGRKSDALAGRYDKLSNQGTLEIKNIKAVSAYFSRPFLIKEGLFSFNQDKIRFQEFKAVYGKSDFTLNGTLQDMASFIFAKKKTVKGNFTLRSNYINIDEFMALEPGNNRKQSEEIKALKSANPKESGVVLIPPGLNIQLNARAVKVSYNDLIINNFNGSLGINRGTMALTNTNFNLIGCNVQMSANYRDRGPMRAEFDFHLQAKDFDVKRAYNEVALFRNMAAVAANAEGIISVDYTLKGNLNANMKPVYRSLQGGGVVTVSQVKISGFRLFNDMGRKAGSKALENPDISQVDIRTSIRNNVITIERFGMRVSVFRPRIEGQTSLDGQLSLRIRLGLPPLGLIGIPIVVDGSYDNPRIRYFRRTTKDLDDSSLAPDMEEK